MKRSFLAATLGASLAFVIAWQAAAQQPSSNQLVVQAANTPGAAPVQAAAAKGATSVSDDALQTLLKEFQEAKKRNEELMKKQEATLQQLDEVQKAAEQLKIFAKRA